MNLSVAKDNLVVFWGRGGLMTVLILVCLKHNAESGYGLIALAFVVDLPTSRVNLRVFSPR